MKSAPTLDDVAREAGVSTATVSRCLNAPDLVIEKTRKKVMDAVEALGYTPNFAAKVMAAKRSYTIGAIIPTMENAVFAEGVQAFQDELHKLGYTLLISSSAYKPDLEEEQVRTLVARGADGLLLIGHERDPKIYDYLAQQRVPAIAAWTYREDGAIPSIGFDNLKAMFGVAERAVALGHRSIAMISGVREGNDRAQLRVKGVQEAMRIHGLNPDELQVLEVKYEVEQGAQAFSELMSTERPPSVILCGNDVIAAGAMIGAERLGLSVPEDVSITGFDDIALARVMRPSLTTVHVPHHEMGRMSAQALVDMVENKNAGRSTSLPTELKIGASLGAYVGAYEENGATLDK